MKPELIHLYLVHLPILGLFIGTVLLIVALIMKEKVLTVAAAVLIFVTSSSVPFIMASGEKAFERYQKEPSISSHMDFSGMHWAKHHYQSAEKGSKLTYLLMLLSAATLVVAMKRPEFLRKMGIVLVVFSIAAFAVNTWIASSGGKIRRPDFQQTEKHFS